MKIGLDIDGVLANFSQDLIIAAKQFGYGNSFPSCWDQVLDWGISKDFSKVYPLVKDHKEFWTMMSRHPGSHFSFDVTAYITARSIPDLWTLEWFQNHPDLPVAPVFQVQSPEDKIQIIKDLDLDIFVDDKFETVVQVNEQTKCRGVLMWARYNQDAAWGGHRISSLSELNEYEL